MISIDTNVIVRFLTEDDPEQFQKSVQIFSNQDIFIPNTVILETEWVLRYAYRFSRFQILDAFRKIFGLPNVYFRDSLELERVMEWYKEGLDFADAFHLAQSLHCQKILTFDRRFVNKAKNLSSCHVQKV